MTEHAIEMFTFKFDRPVSIQEWVEIRIRAKACGYDANILPMFFHGQLIGLLFNDDDVAVAFRLSWDQ